MRTTTGVLLCAFVLAEAAGAAAQTKFTGSCKQGKPDPNYTVPVADRASHTMVLAKVTCTWTEGELAGDKLTTEEDTVSSDLSRNTSRDRGYGVGALASGDKYFVRFDGTTTFKNNAPTSATCNWSFTGGTGKLKGLTGKGTCSATYDATGAAVFQVQGEYQLGTAKAK